MTSVSTVRIKQDFFPFMNYYCSVCFFMVTKKETTVSACSSNTSTKSSINIFLLSSKWEDATFSDRKWNNSLLASSRKKYLSNCLVTYSLPSTFRLTPSTLFSLVAADQIFFCKSQFTITREWLRKGLVLMLKNAAISHSLLCATMYSLEKSDTLSLSIATILACFCFIWRWSFENCKSSL